MKFVLLRLPVVLFAVLTPGARAQTQAAVAWKTFADPAGRFSVLMPGEPTAQTQTKPSAGGQPASTTRLFTLQQGDNGYLAGVTAYDPSAKLDVEKELASERDVFVTNIGAKLLKDSRRKFGQFPALQFRAANPPAYFSVLVVLAGNDCFMAVASYRTPDEPPDATRFLNSLKLLAP